MGWIVSVGSCMVDKKGEITEVPSDIIKAEGRPADYVLGPSKNYFKAKQSLEALFKGITNVDYHNTTEGMVKDWPYVRFFEIFEYSDPEYDNNITEWELKRNNPGIW